MKMARKSQNVEDFNRLIASSINEASIRLHQITTQKSMQELTRADIERFQHILNEHSRKLQTFKSNEDVANMLEKIDALSEELSQELNELPQQEQKLKKKKKFFASFRKKKEQKPVRHPLILSPSHYEQLRMELQQQYVPPMQIEKIETEILKQNEELSKLDSKLPEVEESRKKLMELSKEVMKAKRNWKDKNRPAAPTPRLSSMPYFDESNSKEFNFKPSSSRNQNLQDGDISSNEVDKDFEVADEAADKEEYLSDDGIEEEYQYAQCGDKEEYVEESSPTPQHNSKDFHFEDSRDQICEDAAEADKEEYLSDDEKEECRNKDEYFEDEAEDEDSGDQNREDEEEADKEECLSDDEKEGYENKDEYFKDEESGSSRSDDDPNQFTTETVFNYNSISVDLDELCTLLNRMENISERDFNEIEERLLENRRILENIEAEFEEHVRRVKGEDASEC